MSDIDEIRETWRILERLDARDLRVRELVSDGSSNAGFRFAVGLDLLGRRHLLVPVEPNRKVVEDRRSAGVQVVRHTLVDGQEIRTFVDVVCAKAHLNELFDVVANEMIVEVRER